MARQAPWDACVAVVVATLIALISGCSQDVGGSAATATSAATPSSGGLTAPRQQLAELADALANDEKRTRDMAWVPRMRGGDERPTSGNATLMIEPGTFTSAGLGRATVKAHSGNVEATLYLQQVDGHWLVVSMSER